MMPRHGPPPSPELLAEYARRRSVWSEWAALGFCAKRPLGRIAVAEGWVCQLVDFVREQHRLPDGREQPRLKREAERNADWCAAILAAADERPIDATVARAMQARRSRLSGFVMAQPIPVDNGDAA